MVFVSKNITRKCKYCDNEPKKNLSSGRNKGYNRTCGSKICLKKQYEDTYVCILKGRVKNNVNGKCDVCEKEFKRLSPSHKRYCIDCVPDKSWRARAQRYRIGKPQWQEIIEKQKNKCCLCDKKPEVVDHCHQTGKIRGLLCNSCNLKVGIIEKDINFIDKTFNYLGFIYVQK